ncbi:MAG TPA: type II toxin-antitoxin system VapC family toxin [Humisphaera sp.]
MPLLLDTCIQYWLIDGQTKLTAKALEAIQTARGELYVSTVSAFEVAMNHSKGRVPLPRPPQEWDRRTLRLYRVRSKPVTTRIALRSVSLPEHHKDPFDRLILATAAIHRMPVVTSDRHLPSYTDVTTIW